MVDLQPSRTPEPRNSEMAERLLEASEHDEIEVSFILDEEFGKLEAGDEKTTRQIVVDVTERGNQTEIYCEEAPGWNKPCISLIVEDGPEPSLKRKLNHPMHEQTSVEAFTGLILDKRPEWLPDQYDPTDSLYERLPVIAEMDGGIEMHVGDGTGRVEVAGSPFELTEGGHGNYRLKAGSSEFNWDYEIVVPSGDAPARLEEVDPDQDVEDYYDSRTTLMTDIDVRVYGVDTGRLEGDA